MFTRQHYEKIAEILRKRKPRMKYGIDCPDYNFWTILVREFDNLFKEDNPKYNSYHFLAACNYKEKE